MIPLAIDLFCGLGGWTEGLLAEGYYVVGFDIERHDYGIGGYPGQLVLQDVMTLHGKQFKDATLIVASPPCQAYSYRAMPWSRAKALPPPDNSLFEACFRIQREAIEAADHFIPLVVENVRGAQKWVGRSRWNYGSYHLWGDVPALMPMTKAIKNPDCKTWYPPSDPRHLPNQRFNRLEGQKVPGFRFDGSGKSFQSASVADQAEHDSGVKGFAPHGQPLGKNELGRKHGSKSKARKAASAAIAKIPFPLARYIARTWLPSRAALT